MLRTFSISVFFFNDTTTAEIYTLSLHDALPIFDITAASTDNESGIAGYSWPTISGWTGAGGSAALPHNQFSRAPSSAGTNNVTASNGAGTPSSNGRFTPPADAAGPTRAAPSAGS